MKVYQNYGTMDIDKEDFIIGLSVFPFKITSAKIIPKPGLERDSEVLSLCLTKEEKNGYSCTYRLTGDKFTKNFLDKMHVKIPEDLVGKEVFGYMNIKESTLNGLIVKK
jgi:hypothetical protein